MHIGRKSVAFSLFMIFKACAWAQEPEVTRLDRNLQSCANCHGAPAFENPTSDNFLVPRLGGQQAEYIVKALKAYKTRQRDHFFMRGIAASLSEDEMQELAAYFSSQPSKAGAKK
jgi:cytochrome c553